RRLPQRPLAPRRSPPPPTRRSSDLDVRIAVRVGDREDRDLELAGLVDRDVLLVRIDHEQHTGQLVHALDAAERLHQLVAIALDRSEEHTSELQSRENLVCRLLLEKK